MAYPEPLEALVVAFEKFPGVGRRTAERLAFHVLREPEARGLSRALDRAVAETVRCGLCRNVARHDPCDLCSDPEREDQTLCVVEEPRHVEALERAGVYRGRYHVLMGALQPASGIDAEHLGLDTLIERARSSEVVEVILATDPDSEGEATALLVLEAIDAAGLEVKVSRLARGLPAGSALDYLHKGILLDALEGRRALRGT